MPDAAASSFTSAELVLLRYIQSHAQTVPDLSARELAAKAGCSAATVVRLSRKLGYSGYTEYRFALRRQKHPAVSAESMPQRDILAETAATSHLNQAKDIERTADLLAERDTVILVGGGLTHTALEYLHHYLFSASCPTICMPNDELSLDAIASAGPDAVVLCITSSLTSDLVTFCDICLLATSAPRTDSRIASRLGIVAIADEIARTYSHRHHTGQVIEKEARA